MFLYQFIHPPKTFIIHEKIVKAIFSQLDKTIQNNQSGTINIVFLDNENIKLLNNTYRKQNKTTDVLSFHYYDDFSELEKEETA
jgi:ssRNA-specific RNase YbeY (16S rRNA maturation enzyme)